MSHRFTLKSMIKEHRLTMVDTMLLSILESALFVAQFYFIGKAINDLLNNSWSGVFILIALFLAKILVSFIKQSRINKTYKAIYDELVIKTIGKPLSDGEDIAVLAPKNAIIYLITDFFKGDLIKGFETIVRLILVLIALLILNKIIFLMAIGLAFLVFLLYSFRRKTSIQLSKGIADEFVKEATVLEKKEPESLYRHHRSMETLNNNFLGISAVNLLIIEILSFVFLIISIVILVKTEGENALGSFFAMLYYVMAFSETMFLLPSIYQNYLRTQELSKKVK